MLVSVVLHLHALAPGQIQGSAGRAVHGFWLNQWQTAAPTLSLHQSSASQPFTLSPLMGLPPPQRGLCRFSAGQTAWLRVVTLSQTLSQALLETWLPALPAHIQLADTAWAIHSIALSPTEHPWAGQISYDHLIRRHRQPPPANTWSIAFHTPTAFRSGENGQLPFPLPDSLINSWLRRWQAFSPHPLPEDLSPGLREALHISAYDLKTVPVRHGRRLEIGCVGQITLNGRAFTPQEKAIINLLAHYAFYCGSGRHTTQGMGLTRLLENHRP